jgi:predicted phage baseplate assembly protein
MRLADITLDDRTFQDLVNEARLRITQRCPEWNEHNVSDPGITLIELFAWMTEATIYRLNRVPDKLHVALLNLLGIQIAPPNVATTDIRFRLAAPPEQPLLIPGGATEVGTVRTASEESIVFQTSEDFVIPTAHPIAYAVKRDGNVKDVGVAGGVARPKGGDQHAFGSPPKVGDALYLGFDETLLRTVLSIDVDCSQARGAGIDPEDPPLRWEVSCTDEPSGWAEAEVLEDLTGGFNYGSGTVTLQLPDRHDAVSIAGHRGYWVCCRVDNRTRSGRSATTFSEPPEIRSITAAPIGALIPSSHASREELEELGTSDGTPAQIFELRHYPVLEATEDEYLEVRDPLTGAWERWEEREAFAESRSDDRHYVLDLAHGEVELGPVIRTVDGSWRQYGQVPPKDATLRFTRYRHGGGRRGNVAAGTLTVLKGAIPGVMSVTNPKMALGGVDLESLDSARTRAAMEIRTRYRAVTAEDFEFLCGEASPRVARAVCVPPEREGVVRIHILPIVPDADRKLAYAELTPQDDLMREVAEYLDDRKLIGTSLQILPVKLHGISVVVKVQAARHTDLQRVEEDVTYALNTFLNPLVGGSVDGIGDGWEFGRAYTAGELFGLIRKIDGVEFVKLLRTYETDLAEGTQEQRQAGDYIEIGPHELIASGNHQVKAEHPED